MNLKGTGKLFGLGVALAFLALAAGNQGQTGWAQVRTGAWVDEVVFFQQPNVTQGVEAVKGGTADLYAFAVSDPSKAKTIKDGLGYKITYGSTVDLTFNPYGPFYKDGRLNPFYVPAIREAMNWLIDREYIVQNVYGGVTAVPQYTAITPASADYAKLADIIRCLEVYYSHDPEKAKAEITKWMLRLGATWEEGKWYYGGEPVIVKCLIRSDDERKDIGKYVAELLTSIGFEVKTEYRVYAEAVPYWLKADPAEGVFDIYTGGWTRGEAISRDQTWVFDYFYTPRGRSDPHWQAYHPSPELDDVADRLARGGFLSEKERRELMTRALELSMKDSVRIWVVRRIAYVPLNPNISVASDLVGGVAGSWLWSRTLRFQDRVGGTARVAVPSVLTGAWNPIAGTNWPYDQMIIRGTGDYATLACPHTGLYWPQNVEKAEVYVAQGQYVHKTLDWIDLKFVEEIVVPADAWADWDARHWLFITAGKRFGSHSKTLARSKVVVTFSEGVFERTWHDGSKMTLGDMILRFILMFDRAKPDGWIYDETAVPAFEEFMKYFKGLRILQTSPKVVFEVYSDLVDFDVEYMAARAAGYLWPSYEFGVAPWHVIALGYYAEEQKEVAFSAAKAKELGVEQTSYIAGPSVGILGKHIEQYLKEARVPYWVTLGQYVTEEEARTRWGNLLAWYKAKGHLWVSNGPLYVEKVDPVQKNVVLRRFDGFTDPAEKWARFTEPKIPKVYLAGPYRKDSRALLFEVGITFKDAPYPPADIDSVRYQVFNVVGELELAGFAEPVDHGSQGVWEIILYLFEIVRLMSSPGQKRLEVEVVSKYVVIPGFASLIFEVK